MGRAAVALVCAAAAVACSPAIDSGNRPCDAGCPDSMACGYALDGGCDAQGVCLPTHPCPGGGKQPAYPGCFTPVVVQSCEIPPGYSPAPVQEADASGEPDAAGQCTSTQMILASSYDQSCATDSDCTPVGEGSVCFPCDFVCASGAAINVTALQQYTADVARSPAGPAVATVACGCPFNFGPCCVGGTCHMGQECPGPSMPVTVNADASARGDATDGGPG